MTRCSECLEPNPEGQNVGKVMPYGPGKATVRVEGFCCSGCVQELLRAKREGKE